jgi:hypothetical protein
MKPPPYSERRSLSTPRLACSRLGRAPFRVTGARCGSALITAIVFALIVAITLAGLGTLTVSHYTLAHTQADSAAALDLAEAGVNFELNYLTTNGGQAEPTGTINPASQIDPSLNGTFTVSCKNLDGTDWAGPTLTLKTVVITSTATVNGSTRIVRIQGKPTGTFYTMYSTDVAKGAFTQFLGSNSSVDGVSGTDGNLLIASSLITMPKITSIVFNGQYAQWYNNKPVSGYSTVVNSKPVVWPTVTSLLNRQIPGGADYLSQPSNNDNNLAILTDPAHQSGQPQAGIVRNKLSTSGSQTVTLVGKPGGANYYLNSISMSDQSDLVFDNSKGPINIYYLNNSGKQQILRGGHSTQSLTDNPANRVTMYLSATGDMVIRPNANNDEIDMGIYAYDIKKIDGDVTDFGDVVLDDNVNFKGQIIANEITINNNVTVTGQRGYFETPEELFGFNGAWEELNSDLNIGGGSQ